MATNFLTAEDRADYLTARVNLTRAWEQLTGERVPPTHMRTAAKALIAAKVIASTMAGKAADTSAALQSPLLEAIEILDSAITSGKISDADKTALKEKLAQLKARLDAGQNLNADSNAKLSRDSITGADINRKGFDAAMKSAMANSTLITNANAGDMAKMGRSGGGTAKPEDAVTREMRKALSTSHRTMDDLKDAQLRNLAKREDKDK